MISILRNYLHNHLRNYLDKRRHNRLHNDSIARQITKVVKNKWVLTVTLLSVLFSCALMLYMGVLASSIRHSEQTWLEFSREASETNHLLQKIQSEFGYGGFIHNYKNLVLRKDARLIPVIKNNILQLNGLFDSYRALTSLDKEERQALLQLEEVYAEYKQHLAYVVQAVENENVTSIDIDKRVKVDDVPALQAIAILTSTSLAKQKEKEIEASNALEENLAYVRLGSLLLWVFVLYTGIVVFFVFRLARVTDRLRDATAFQDSLFHSSPDSIIVIDQTGRISKTNHPAESFTQYTGAELTGMLIEELIPERFRVGHLDLREQFFNHEATRSHGSALELVLLAKNGQEYPVDIAIRTMQTKDGILAILNVRDITEAKRIHNALVERESMLNQAQSVAKVGCWKWDFETDTIQLSEEAKRIYGVDLSENDFSNEVLSEKIPDHEKEMVANAINETMLFKKTYHVQHHIYSGDGMFKTVEQFGELSIDNTDKIIAMLGVVKDITKTSESEYELKLARNVFNYSAEAILVTDADNRVLKINPAFFLVMGYVEDEVHGRKADELVRANRHSDEFFDKLWLGLEKTDIWQGELWCKRKSGEVFPTQQTISSVRNEDGRIIQYIYLLKDITNEKKQQEHIQNLAHYDQLTGLPNRALFMDRIKRSIIRAKRKRSLFALLFVDLDRFKYVNDSLGHDAGDELLIAISERLIDAVREQDTVSRLGGDEFTLILEEIAKQDDSLAVTQKIIDSVCKPIVIQGHEIVVGASIGVSIFPDHGETEDVLIKSADTAMYRAKESGRNQSKLYDQSMSTATSEKFHLEMLLRKAIDEDELELYFQPQINLTNACVSGCEALVRWNHPEHGVVGPIEFIPLAEETGLIIPLGQWVLHRSLELCSQWQGGGMEELTISVNVSSKQLSDLSFLDLVSTSLATFGISSNRLELEITESAVMDNPTQVIAMLQQIRDLGVGISLDDFGTGYSSLSYLKKLPVNKVKIDRSFVRDVNVDKDDEEIVKAIIAMSSSLGLKVIAEGAESKDHIDFIRSTDCEDVQGYYYSRPLPEHQFIEFVHKFNQIDEGQFTKR